MRWNGGPQQGPLEQPEGLGSTANNYQPEPGFGALGALLPSRRTEALFSVSFSKGVQTALLEH